MTGERAWLALNAAELPPRTVLELLDRLDSPDAIMSATPSALSSTVRLTPGELTRIVEARQRDYQPVLKALKDLGARLVTIRDTEYPGNLRNIHDPPPMLFVRGQIRQADEQAIAIVGTRRATPYGRMVSEALGRDLAARGLTIVSGLAVGVDAAAHRGALTAAGGRTIGVLACGIDVPYPRETMELREQAVARGAVISEVPPGTPARPARFIARNRLISGLSLGVVVTEAPERSGALITAEIAADQGRQVFAVPGSVNSELSRGTHDLLRDGARLAASADDVLDELDLTESAPQPVSAAEPEQASDSGLSGDERSILSALSLQQRHVDDIVHHCQLPVSRTSAGLLMLELKGLVRRLPGNMFMRVR
ncbi:MAG: DNA-processing protein DprA [Armatimonadota bacterium]